MSETIEQKCLAKGVKLTDQRKIIAQVMSESTMIILMLMNFTIEFQRLIIK